MNLRDRDPIDYERSIRSVFVGNIPYEASEEQLKDVFNEVGTVVSFRLVFDRESGKPKGYGFAEYQDQETAMSAMRNLNGRELHGRSLRVDHATSEKNRNNFQEEVDQFRAMGPPAESDYGDPTPPQDAPEAISKAVASLPPEQMFELMKQMKQCIQNNPVEARNMLLQNPQLAYALLQAQVVMRIVDPEIAMKMLHRRAAVQPLVAAGEGPREEPRSNGGPLPPMPGLGPDRPMDVREREIPMDTYPERERLPPPPSRRMEIDTRAIERIPVDEGMGDPLERHMDRRRRSRSPDRFGRDMRDPHFMERGMGLERGIPVDRGPPMDRGMHMERGRPSAERGLTPPPHRGMPPMDRRGPPMDRPMNPGPPEMVPRMTRPPPPPERAPEPRPSRPTETPPDQDQEKAALIMQVLQLTPEQIKMLPEEQRKSILALKDQIQGGRQ